MQNYKIIITGFSDLPLEERRGGIGYTYPGYVSVFDKMEYDYRFVYTYDPFSFSGKYLPWIKGMFFVAYTIIRGYFHGEKYVIISHAGASWSLVRESILVAVGRLLGAKTMLQIHAPEISKYLENPIQRRLLKLSFMIVNKISVLTPYWKELVDSITKTKISVIPNSLSPAWENIALHEKPISCKNSKIQVLVMSRIVRGKGADLVIESSQYLHKGVIIKVAGVGEMLSSLQERVVELGLEKKVQFLGWVSGEEKQSLLDASSVFCHPTKLDAMPMCILEAMVNGIPIVAFDWGPISELVPNNKVGILISRLDPLELSKAINKLQNSELRQKMGMAGKKWVLSEYSSDAVSLILKKAIKELCNEH